MASLSEYHRKRDRSRTPEPFGGTGGDGDRFVIQEHHARRLHWDFRLERDGVLVSWAIPKGLPPSPKTNHLAVHTEDHPLDYGDFEGEIPAGEYGAGKVYLWDRGTYETQKWTDREVMVVLHGKRSSGRYVLFRTRDKDWMIHRMDPPVDPAWEPLPERVRPMLPVDGPLPTARTDDRWGYEFAWDGRRALVYVEGGRAVVRGPRGDDLTDRYPELRALGPDAGSRTLLLDGEIVALDESGRPSPSRLRHRVGGQSAAATRRLAGQFPVTYLVVDLLHDAGRSTVDLPYLERRELLDGLPLSGPAWQVTPWWSGGGREVRRTAAEQGLSGVVAKRLDSTYQPGTRSPDWRRVR